MIEVSIDIDAAQVLAGLDVMPAVVDAESAKAMQTSVFIVEAEVKGLTPRKTGRLFSAWASSVRLSPKLTGIVANNVSYAPYVERGTAPHDIWAKPGSALYWPGAQHPVSHVRHPGFAGRFMARTAAVIAKPKVAAEFRRALKEAIRIAMGK